ncbi:transposase [Candidatus Daviesbacteria bacterium]|nr:transposase [Candidatus Daviesbacteria bacterium]
MAYRKTPVVNGEIYHVYNRSNGQQEIFLSAKDYQRAMEVFRFYLFGKPSLRFSFYNRLPKDQKPKYLEGLYLGKPIVDIIGFCLMPNHFHFLLKGLEGKGINQFISNFQNSYAKYFNIKMTRTGSLFQQNFRAVRIESDEQLIHVSRYIHLNPITAFLVRTMEELEHYQWSSYPDYIQRGKTYIKKGVVLDHFRSIADYKQFMANQIDYQRKLDRIKHLLME